MSTIFILQAAALTKAGGVVECEVVHHSGPEEAPPEEEVLSSLLHRSAVLLTGLIRDRREELVGAGQDPYELAQRGAAVTLMTLCSTTESSHSMKDSTVAFFLSSSFNS